MKPPTLDDIFAAMQARFGPTHWWPGDSPFEIAVGAILTQNTNWTNVERAIANLKRLKLLGPRRILRCDPAELETAIRSSGYFRQKAKRLRGFCAFLEARYRGSMARMAQAPLDTLREELLALNGIGPETADDILLYACGKPVFVVDTYTRRILSRHGLVPEKIKRRTPRLLRDPPRPRRAPLFRISRPHRLYRQGLLQNPPRLRRMPPRSAPPPRPAGRLSRTPSSNKIIAAPIAKTRPNRYAVPIVRFLCNVE